MLGIRRIQSGVTPGLFFIVAIAYKLAWTAISSLLSQFSRDYGPNILLYLNIAYFLPSIPVLILQTYFNDAIDRRLGGARRGAALRFSIGLGGLVLLTGCFTSIAATYVSLIATTVAVGAAYGVAFGTSYQMASKFPPICTVMLTTGFVSSGPLVLALDLALKTGPYYTPDALSTLFSAVACVTGVGLCASWSLLALNRRAMEGGGACGRSGGGAMKELTLPPAGAMAGMGGYGRSKDRWLPSKKGHTPRGSLEGSHHSSSHAHARHRTEGGHDGVHGGWGTSSAHAAMLDDMEGGSGGYVAVQAHGGPGSHSSSDNGTYSARGSHSYGAHPKDKTRKLEVPLWRIAVRIAPVAFAIFLSVGTSMLVFPFFTFMHSTGLLGARLPQVLFYIRLVGDIGGRLVPKRFQATRVRALLMWAGVKTAMVPLLFAAIFRPHSTGGDVATCVYVAVFWVLSGYLNTCAYLVAPTLVSPSQKARASGVMTVAFQTSCFLALLGAAAVQHTAFALPLPLNPLAPEAGASGKEGVEGELFLGASDGLGKGQGFDRGMGGAAHGEEFDAGEEIGVGEGA